MSWLVNEELRQEELANQFLQLVRDEPILKLVGAHDAMAGLMAKRTGFKALYLSGAAYTASKGLPDLGLIYSTEIANHAKDIIRATQLPVLVDIDTGYGGVLNVARAAREMLDAGVAAVQIEDQSMPKKCGHLNGKNLVSIEEMVQKIQAIKKVAPTLVVVARTDAHSVENLDGVIQRAKAYMDAGADVIFPEALIAEEEFSKVKDATKAPILANMTEFGKTPYYSAEQFQKFGCDIVIYPVTSLRVAAKAYERVYQEIYETGSQKEKLEDMQTRKELYEVIQYHDYEEMDKEIAKTTSENYHE
ncbi:methylisocitrate lyase [Planococcus versutus]|uniref:Methylisocitrate lyase n=1 Tax=Planococcus versutus TaxID=1302659 RepID=A0A1B1S315_9BACL|nr:methylisocitrate lyase [Planococcus versutus]ANU27578.1 methylisocitrate lyase [Planococcus versutus]